MTDPTTSHATADTPGRPATTPRREATRRRVLEAARQVFAERGVAESSVDDVARAAGFTKGAVYSNFRDKEDLLLSVFAEMSDALLAAAERAIDTADLEGADPESAVALVLESFATLDRDWALIHAEYALYALRHPEATRELDEHLCHCETRLAAMLEIALHRLGREPAVPLDTLVDLVLSVYITSLSEDAVHHGATVARDKARRVLPQLLYALSRPL